MKVIELTIEDAEFVAYELAAELFALDEPFPEFHTRYRHRLESVLAAPFASFGGVEQYSTLEEKASILFYMTCKDHPFQNGNKRMAVVLMMVFLFLNNQFLKVTPMELYDRAMEVTKSAPSDREGVIQEMATFVRNGLVSREEFERYLTDDDVH